MPFIVTGKVICDDGLNIDNLKGPRFSGVLVVVQIGVFLVERSNLDVYCLPLYRPGSGCSWKQFDRGLHVCMHLLDDIYGSFTSGYLGFLLYPTS